METRLGVKDRKILLELDMDARKPDSAIAKSVGLSKQVTNYRIKRLENKGIIHGYVPVIDHAPLGIKLYKVLLKLENLDKEKEEALKSYLTGHASWLVEVLGGWDVAFGIYVKDEYEFMDFWRRFYDIYGYAVKDRMMTLMTRFWNFERSFLFPQCKDRNQAFIIGSKKQCVEIDDVDDAILKELTRGARQTSLEIAKKVKQTERVVRYRIARLEKEKVLLGYRAVIDTSLLGLKFYKLFISLKNAKKDDIKRIMDYITQCPNVGYSTEALGGPDFELEAYFQDSQALFNFITELKETFPHFIKSTEHMEYIKEHKVTYYPK
jgi:Lrp/AsnC family leucine-responsive transcriptional regulator